MEVTLPRGIFTRRYNEGGRRKRILEAVVKEGSTIYQFTKYKYDQSIFPQSTDVRKISAACASCLPNAILQFDEDLKALGIQNCFDVNTRNEGNLVYQRWFPFLSYFWQKGWLVAQRIRTVRPQEILDDSELFTYANYSVKDFEHKSLEEKERIIKKWNLIATRIANDICTSQAQGSYYSWSGVLFLRIVGWLWEKLLARIFETVSVHLGEIELLQRASDTDLPIVYVPINRSFMDPLVFHWTLLYSGLSTPYFLTSSSFRYFTKFFGGLGTSSKASSTTDPDESLIRTCVLSSCIRTLFKKSATVQLYLEPRRSRNGNASTELYSTELLKILNDLFVSKEIEDAYIVPVTVSYEKLPEDCCDDFNFSQSDNHWTLTTVLKKILKCMRKGLGQVRVDYGQPFSLRDFHPSIDSKKKFTSAKDESYARAFELRELCWDSKHSSSASIPSLYGEMDFIDSGEQDDDSTFLNILANHIVYAGVSSSTVMPTHIVAFLLLKRFRYGTNLGILIDDVTRLRQLIEKRGRDVGFAGDDVASVVLRALEFLGPETVLISKKEDQTGLESLSVGPVLKKESLCRLGYYSNNIMPILAMEGVVAVAIFSLIGNQLNTARGFDFDVRVKDEDLLRHSREVYEVFTSEFFLHPPCLTAETAIRKTFDTLNDSCVLQFLMDETLKRSKRHYGGDFDDDSDDGVGIVLGGGRDKQDPLGLTTEGEFFFTPYEYKVISTEENYDEISFLRNLLVPYLEVYAVIALELQCLVPSHHVKDCEMEVGFLRKKILQKIQITFPEAEYGELLTSEVVKTSLFAFEEHGILICNVDKITKARSMCLNDKYNNLKALEDVSSNIMRYVTWM